jgi:hypothetical protein
MFPVLGILRIHMPTIPFYAPRMSCTNRPTAGGSAAWLLPRCRYHFNRKSKNLNHCSLAEPWPGRLQPRVGHRDFYFIGTTHLSSYSWIISITLSIAIIAFALYFLIFIFSLPRSPLSEIYSVARSIVFIVSCSFEA